MEPLEAMFTGSGVGLPRGGKRACDAGEPRSISGDNDFDAGFVQHLDLVRGHPRVGDDDINVA